MSVIKFKKFEKPDEWGNTGPRIDVYSEAIHWILVCLHSIAQIPGEEVPNEITITSINDSLHGKGSRHYLNEAMDIRSKNFRSKNAKLYFAARLHAMLNSHQDDPNKFTVLFENEGAPEEHFHVQVRKGESFMRF